MTRLVLGAAVNAVTQLWWALGECMLGYVIVWCGYNVNIFGSR